MVIERRGKDLANTSIERKEELSIDENGEDSQKKTPYSFSIEEITQYIYYVLYLIGAQVIRTSSRIIRKAGICFENSKQNTVSFAKKLYTLLCTQVKNVNTKIKDNTSEIGENFKRYKNCRSTKESNKEELQNVLHDLLLPVRRVASYVLPVCAIFVLVGTITYYQNLTYALAVEYNGHNIGFIAEESVFNTAEADVKSRFLGEKYLQPEDKIPIFTLEVTDKQELSTSDQIADQIIMASGNEIKKADGLYIDSKFIGATIDGDDLLLALEDYKEDYKKEHPSQEVSFVNRIGIKEGVYPVSQIVDLDEIEKTIHSQVKTAKTYKIKAGDSPTLVAQNMGIPTAELIARNPEVSKTFVVGQELLIQASQNYLTLKGTERVTYEEDIDYGVEKVNDSNLYEGVQRVVKSGQSGVAEVTADVTYVDGLEESRTIIQSDVVREPVDQVVSVGTKKPNTYLPSNASGKSFMWPVDGGYVSCRIWGYPGHTGMDIAASAGTPVRASAAGTVVYSGWNSTGYGYMVLIDHGGGIQTLYAHNSALDVSYGQSVQQGQVISRIGRTGRASGNHCHFELRMNGRFVDPGIYVGYSYNR